MWECGGDRVVVFEIGGLVSGGGFKEVTGGGGKAGARVGVRWFLGWGRTPEGGVEWG